MRISRDRDDIESHVSALRDSFDDNIETSISFFREEIDKLTQDDELTLMEIIEQASRKKHAQDASEKDRRAHASRQSHRPTPPLAPRNSRMPTTRAASRSSHGRHQRAGAPSNGVPRSSSDDSETVEVMGELANKLHHYEEKQRKASEKFSDDSKPRRNLKEPLSNEPFDMTADSYGSYRVVDQDSSEGLKRIDEKRNPSPERRRIHEASSDRVRMSRHDPHGQVSVREPHQPHVDYSEESRIQQQRHYEEMSRKPTEYSHVKPRSIDRVPSEPQGTYAKRTLATPAAKDKQPLFPTDAVVIRNSIRNSKGGTDPPNIERMENVPLVKRTSGFVADATGLSKASSSSEVEAWRCMVQLLQDTLDRQKEQVQKLEKENEELRADNRKLRQEMSSMLETMDRSIDTRHRRPPIPVVHRRSDASIDQYSLDQADRSLERTRFVERSEQSDDWSLPGPATVSESRSTPSYLHHTRRSSRSQRIQHAFSPPVPEVDRVEGIPQNREMGVSYRPPLYDNEQRYFAPVPKYAYNPGTQVVGGANRTMHLQQNYLVPRPYLEEDYYGGRPGPGTRDPMYR